MLFPQFVRAEVLDRVSLLISEQQEELTQIIAAEAGKPSKAARVEAARCSDHLRLLVRGGAKTDWLHRPDGGVCEWRRQGWAVSASSFRGRRRYHALSISN